jgi:hypothetical protein
MIEKKLCSTFLVVIFEEMKQKRYDDYLQEDASTNFNTLSRKQ